MGRARYRRRLHCHGALGALTQRLFEIVGELLGALISILDLLGQTASENLMNIVPKRCSLTVGGLEVFVQDRVDHSRFVATGKREATGQHLVQNNHQ